MENFLRPIYQERASDLNTLGILFIEKVHPHSPLTDNFDMILLIIIEKSDTPWFVTHYEKNEKKAAMHVVTREQLTEWIDTSGYRRAVEWIINGKVIYDRNEFVAYLKKQLQDFPIQKRNLRKTIDFGKLIKNFHEAKKLYDSKEYKDAHNKIMNCLHYLARLAVLEKGYYPEVMVWNQVKKIDIEVYKLYEEFILSREDLSKKIKLMMIAVDYMINNRTESAITHLLERMRTQEEWSYAELKQLPDTQAYTLDLSLIISYLVEKEYIDLVREETTHDGVYQLKYKVKNNSPLQ